jgi:gluconolactonase
VVDKGVPDGIRCDANGNIWSSAGDGVQIFSPDGKLIGKILVPETPANLAFGGADGKTLFMTAHTSLYRINTAIAGAKAK